MLDGSDAVADWPILNALVNVAGGASWVSLHHGGGVGMGYSIHAGMVIVADGTEEAADRLSRVLKNDPGMGVIRHMDAGYETAKETAKANGLDIYQDEKLLTGWAGLMKAYIAPKEKKGFFEIRDNVVLVIEYRNEGTNQGIRRKIPLTNTQNKSEEDVLQAVNFFWKEYKRETGPGLM